MQPILPKLLIFVRHAIAEPKETFSGSDSERPLTKKGAEKAKKVFTALHDLCTPTRIIASPLLRARATAEIYLGLGGAARLTLETAVSLSPDGTWEAWRCEMVKLSFTTEDTVILFGHEPSLSILFAHHLGLSSPSPFKKAGFAVLRPTSLTSASLVAFASPKLLLGP